MSYYVKIIEDSVAPCGKRCTTMEVKYPRFVHSELMTHRTKSRNSASSRAIPIKKMIENIAINPVMPVYWGTAKSGMQAGEETALTFLAEKIWLEASRQMIVAAQKLGGLVSVNKNSGEVCSDDDPEAVKLDLHKQVVNRVLEPWMWITVIITATDYDNFFALRCHPDAQPEIQHLAYMMREAYDNSTPKELATGDWHIPYIQPDELMLDLETRKSISVARCARVSYLTHDGVRSIEKDLELYDRLTNGSGTGHWSPFEHVARAESEEIISGNFVGFTQLRKTFPGEYQGR